MGSKKTFQMKRRIPDGVPTVKCRNELIYPHVFELLSAVTAKVAEPQTGLGGGNKDG